MRSSTESRQTRHLGVFAAARDLGAPLGELIGGAVARGLRLTQQHGGAIEVAVAERLGDARRVQALIEACAAGIPGGGGLEIGERLRGLIEAAGGERLLEAPREHAGNALQAVAGLGIAGIGGGG